MIVDDLDGMRVSVFPAEADPPLIVDSDAVLASSISGQFLQMIGWRNPEIAQRAGSIQNQQLSESDPLNTRELLGMPSMKNLFGFLTAESLDHVLIIT